MMIVADIKTYETHKNIIMLKASAHSILKTTAIIHLNIMFISIHLLPRTS